jgi:hypothetical protein
MQVTIDPSLILLLKEPAACSINPKVPKPKTTGYMLVTKEGTNLRTYEAKKPSLAAIKAYYSYLRAHKSAWTTPLIDSPKIAEQIRSHVKSETVMTKIMSQTRAPPGVVLLRKLGENKVRKYLVRYEPDLAPNKHQIEKGIFKVAVAQVWEGRDPDDAIHIV